jgi:hypothetical protein
MTPTQIAQTIQSQIGGGTLFMIGARLQTVVPAKPDVNLLGGLYFKTGRVAAGYANEVTIQLAACDTYTVTFKKGKKIIAEIEDAYADQLHELIERYTGLYTRL